MDGDGFSVGLPHGIGCQVERECLGAIVVLPRSPDWERLLSEIPKDWDHAREVFERPLQVHAATALDLAVDQEFHIVPASGYAGTNTKRYGKGRSDGRALRKRTRLPRTDPD
jgi:hypothetical protein